jgi:general secretion pathway protein A
MYESYFGLREPPFNVTPNPQCFFVNSSYQEASSTLCYGIQRRAGIIVITGDAGTGKTTLIKTFLSNAAVNIHSSCILDPHLNFAELLLCTLDVFGLSDLAPDRLTLTHQLNRYLIEQLRKDHFVALLLDEAQGLDDTVLEELVFLSDLEDGGKKLLQIVLIGQPELESRLERSWLRPLKQRVAIRSRLAPLGGDDIQEYIEYRLSAAGYTGKTIFLSHAIERIGVFSKGIPRLVNVICDNALLVACAKSQKVVDGETIEEVADELQLGGLDSAELQPTLARASRLEIPEEASRDAVVGGESESRSGDCWVLNSEQIAGRGTEPLLVDNHFKIGWVTLAVAFVLLFAILGGETLLSPPLEPQRYLAPVTDNVQKVKEFFAPLPGRIYRAVIVNAERLQDPGPFAQARKASAKQTESARGGILIETKQKPKDIGRATAAEIGQRPPRRHQSVESRKPSVSEENFKVVRNSLVRDKPSSTAEIIATLHPGTEIRLVRRIGDYLQIRSTEEGTVRGYVHIEDAFFKPSNNRVSREY